MAVKTRSPWNQRCLLDGKTGLPMWGADYYSNLLMCVVPMARGGETVGKLASAGLVKNMMGAALHQDA